MGPRLTSLLLLIATTALGPGCPAAGDDCAGMKDEVARENCQFERVSALFDAGDAGWKEQLAAIPSAASRDLVRLRLAVVQPQQGPAICAEVETESAKERCRQVVGRPHLASPPTLPPQRAP